MFSQEEYQQKIKLLEDEVQQLKEKLKNYTAPKRSKTFYENHKEEIIKRVKEHKQITNYTYEVSPEKRKEYNKIAYQKRKEKNEQI